MWNKILIWKKKIFIHISYFNFQNDSCIKTPENATVTCPLVSDTVFVWARTLPKCPFSYSVPLLSKTTKSPCQKARRYRIWNPMLVWPTDPNLLKFDSSSAHETPTIFSIVQKHFYLIPVKSWKEKTDIFSQLEEFKTEDSRRWQIFHRNPNEQGRIFTDSFVFFKLQRAAFTFIYSLYMLI